MCIRDRHTFDFKNRTAIVTGGAQGFGLDVAKRFLDSGAKVFIWDIDENLLKRVIDEIKNPNLQFNVVDVANYKDVERNVYEITSKINIDILINNAGITGPTGPLWEYDVETWNKIVQINLMGTFNCCRAIVPNMIKHNYGRIVNVASVHGIQIIPNCFPYPVAKHGVIGLTKALAVDYAAKGIKINSISPGYIDTPIIERFFKTKPDPDAARKEAENHQPIKRMGTTDEIANTIMFMSSDECNYMIGANIVVDGGITLRTVSYTHLTLPTKRIV